MGTLNEAEFLALNKNPVTQKLIELLSHTRSVLSLGAKPTGYLIKRRLVGESKYNHCHTKMLLIKEINFKGDNETILGCSYEVCSKCCASFYDDGQSSRNLSNF